MGELITKTGGANRSVRSIRSTVLTEVNQWSFLVFIWAHGEEVGQCRNSDSSALPQCLCGGEWSQTDRPRQSVDQAPYAPTVFSPKLDQLASGVTSHRGGVEEGEILREGPKVQSMS